MKEGITARVGRIISGTVNALIDAVENAAPEAVMEEAMREIDGAIDEVRSELGIVVANRHLANKRLMQEKRKHEDLSKNITLAVKEGRDDLAEAAIAQQMDVEAQIPVLEHAIADAAEQGKELEAYITALQAKKREMKEELHSFVSSREQAQGSLKDSETAADLVGAPNSVPNKVAKAVAAFDRILEQGTGLPGLSGSPDQKTAAQLAELEDLSRKNRIQERLAEAKATAKD